MVFKLAVLLCLNVLGLQAGRDWDLTFDNRWSNDLVISNVEQYCWKMKKLTGTEVPPTEIKTVQTHEIVNTEKCEQAEERKLMFHLGANHAVKISTFYDDDSCKIVVRNETSGKKVVDISIDSRKCDDMEVPDVTFIYFGLSPDPIVTYH